MIKGTEVEAARKAYCQQRIANSLLLDELSRSGCRSTLDLVFWPTNCEKTKMAAGDRAEETLLAAWLSLDSEWRTQEGIDDQENDDY